MWRELLPLVAILPQRYSFIWLQCFWGQHRAQTVGQNLISFKLQLSAPEKRTFLWGYFLFSKEEQKNSSDLSFDSSEVSFDSSEEISLTSVENFYFLGSYWGNSSVEISFQWIVWRIRTIEAIRTDEKPGTYILWCAVRCRSARFLSALRSLDRMETFYSLVLFYYLCV